MVSFTEINYIRRCVPCAISFLMDSDMTLPTREMGLYYALFFVINVFPQFVSIWVAKVDRGAKEMKQDVDVRHSLTLVWGDVPTDVDKEKELVDNKTPRVTATLTEDQHGNITAVIRNNVVYKYNPKNLPFKESAGEVVAVLEFAAVDEDSYRVDGQRIHKSALVPLVVRSMSDHTDIPLCAVKCDMVSDSEFKESHNDMIMQARFAMALMLTAMNESWFTEVDHTLVRVTGINALNTLQYYYSQSWAQRILNCKIEPHYPALDDSPERLVTDNAYNRAMIAKDRGEEPGDLLIGQEVVVDETDFGKVTGYDEATKLYTISNKRIGDLTRPLSGFVLQRAKYCEKKTEAEKVAIPAQRVSFSVTAKVGTEAKSAMCFITHEDKFDVYDASVIGDGRLCDVGFEIPANYLQTFFDASEAATAVGNRLRVQFDQSLGYGTPAHLDKISQITFPKIFADVPIPEHLQEHFATALRTKELPTDIPDAAKLLGYLQRQAYIDAEETAEVEDEQEVFIFSKNGIFTAPPGAMPVDRTLEANQALEAQLDERLIESAVPVGEDNVPFDDYVEISSTENSPRAATASPGPFIKPEPED